MNNIIKTNYQFAPNQQVYKGKVRDVYMLPNDQIVIISTDRISAFDVVMPRGIPYKGQILNQIAIQSMQQTKDIVPNWLLAMPDPNVAVGYHCQPFKVEMVIRGYLSGHAARIYQQGIQEICGIKLPKGLQTNDKLSKPIITPSTKAEQGKHDEDISREDILKQGLVTADDYAVLEKYTYSLFERGSKIASEQGLILVDTKYEFGKTTDGQIVLIDEIHTPDSSRYFYAKDYEDCQQKGLPQKQLSKEFVRLWLIENNFQGKLGQQIPTMSNDYIQSVSMRYIELYESLIGKPFVKAETSNLSNRIEKNVKTYLKSIKV